MELSGFERPVSKLACSADGKILVAESIDHRIKAWDIATKREVANFTIRDRIESDRLPLAGRRRSGHTVSRRHHGDLGSDPPAHNDDLNE